MTKTTMMITIMMMTTTTENIILMDISLGLYTNTIRYNKAHLDYSILCSNVVRFFFVLSSNLWKCFDVSMKYGYEKELFKMVLVYLGCSTFVKTLAFHFSEWCSWNPIVEWTKNEKFFFSFSLLCSLLTRCGFSFVFALVHISFGGWKTADAALYGITYIIKMCIMVAYFRWCKWQ